jgi:hypothetical protein
MYKQTNATFDHEIKKTFLDSVSDHARASLQIIDNESKPRVANELFKNDIYEKSFVIHVIFIYSFLFFSMSYFNKQHVIEFFFTSM